MLTSILRTLVPALWGSLIGWFLTVVPILEPLRADLLAYGDVAVPVIAALLIGGWYAVCRWLEPHLPDWLTRILLGSAKAPTYANANTISGELATDEERGKHEAVDGYPIPGPHEPSASPERYPNGE